MTPASLIPDPQLSAWRRTDILGAYRLLFLLYRRPKVFQAQLQAKEAMAARIDGAVLYLYALPILLGLTFAIKMAVIYLGAPLRPNADVIRETLYGLFGVITIGLVGWVARRNAAWLAGSIAFGIAYGIIMGTTGGLATGIAYGLAFGFAMGYMAGNEGDIWISLLAGITAASIILREGGVAVGIACGIAAGITFLRFYYHPVVWSATAFFSKPSNYKYHPVAWDDCCRVRFKGLHHLLVNLWTEDPETGSAEILRILKYDSQWEEGLLASTIASLRQMASLPLSLLSDYASNLPRGVAFKTEVLRGLLGEISRQYRFFASAKGAYMRQAHYELLLEKIEDLKYQTVQQPLAQELDAAADQWLLQAAQHQPPPRPAQAVPDVFDAGSPIDAEQEAFIHRVATFLNLKRQLYLTAGCPPLMVYGRRGIGKSTLLRNLPHFLHYRVHPLCVSMQDPAFSLNLSSFLTSLTRLAKASLPADLTVPDVPPKDLLGLSVLLDSWDGQLAPDQRILLCFDDYEIIDRKIAEGSFPEELLDTIHQSIQVHRRILWLFAGCQRLEELPSADWIARLYSAKTQTLRCFRAHETRLLLTDPLGRSPDPKRSEFPILTEFWAEGHLDRVHRESGGWPFLVQHLAQALVDLANERGQHHTTEPLFEEALDRVTEAAHPMLHQLLVAETEPATRAYLQQFVAKPDQPPPTDPDLHRRLIRSGLVREIKGGYSLRAPLMARWIQRHLL